jgi:phage gpG-like protein
VGVTANTSAVDKKLDNLLNVLGRPGMKELGRRTERAIEKSTSATFATASDPYGRPWARRKGKPSWRPLDKSGGLKGSLYTELEVRNKGFLVTVNVRDKASGNRSYHAIAGAQFYGRKDQRSKIVGRGSSTGKGGPMPARKFAGLNKGQRRGLREAVRRAIRRT